nr:hypothetical protein [Oceanococcus sp. HetDA_MAG_MS8]
MMIDMTAPDTTAINNHWQTEPQLSVSAGLPPSGYWPNYLSDPFSVSATHLFEQEQLRRNLQELGSLPDDWDGEGAVAISPSIVARAWSLLSSELLGGPSPELTPNSNGTITLEWNHAHKFLHLEIGERDFSILAGREGRPATGAQAEGLPPLHLLSSLISAATSYSATSATSVTAEKIAA